ncbi:trinucleotide repeat-containing gene 6B protein isoform X1 [Hemiscyllium ocellatum]|uniref:trinucleotide repeat-containing gene 6B protein isoform X1 n=3 Tax=Hemiscyllium ocellatum TaxID=170820 RepID=UPI00296777A6|nr:trinucleotide repeat-containing gene 6B protein isoform X1 [Hemiscyllium ocellatum]XP_060705537.1 trinucleotide repeat-containing gene 6B protein isoform X1 [Hemiscyllium ocellatum]
MQVNDGSRRQQACLKTFMEMEKMTEELHILTKEQDVKAEIQAECEDFTRDEHDDTSESPVEESKQEKEEEKEEQLMEEKKRKKEDKKKKDATQKVTEQKTKVPEATKPSLSQPPTATPVGSVPTPAANGGNNAKRAVATNGQPQNAARYLPREVPPRFRQHEHKVLLKRGQPPPPSCGLLGGGAGPPGLPGSNPGAAQPLTQPNCPLQHGSTPVDTNPGGAGSNYANSAWGSGSSSTDLNHGWDKLIVDGSDMEAWPCITGRDSESASEHVDNEGASNFGSEKSLPPGSGAARSCKGAANQFAAGSGKNECKLGAWNMGLVPKPSHASSISSESKDGLNNWKNLSNPDGAGLGLTLNPNINPSAWPVLGQEGNSGKGTLETDVSSSSAQLSAVGQSPRDQDGTSASAWANKSKTENAGVTWNASVGEQPQALNTDGPNNGDTNSLNANSQSTGNPLQNKGVSDTTGNGTWNMPMGMGLGNPLVLNQSVSTEASSEGSIRGTMEGRGTGGSWNTVWGSSGTDSISGQNGTGADGNSGRNSDDTAKAGSGLKQLLVNRSRTESWDSNSGSWDSEAQDPNKAKNWGKGNRTASSGAQGLWGQQPGTDNRSEGEWSGTPNEQNCGTGGWDNHRVNPLPENQGENSQNSNWVKASSSTGSDSGSRSNNKRGGSENHPGGRRLNKTDPLDQEEVIQSVISRSDLDPRVLSNTGWGQTQIKQNTVWDVQESPRNERRTDRGTEGWESTTTQSTNSGGWGEASSQSSHCNSGWGDAPQSSNMESDSPSGWVDPKNSQGWGGGTPEEKAPSWNDAPRIKEPGWGARQQPTQGWSPNNGWGDGSGQPAEQPKAGGWDSSNSRWGDSGRGEVGSWGGGNSNSNQRSGWEDPTRHQGWGEPSKTAANNWNKQQDVSGSWGTNSAGSRQSGPGWGSASVPPAPIPVVPKEEEPTGWEEPSPQSISRKMEIDDGTSAWGDPNSYNYKNVNLWDKNSQSESSGSGPAPREQNAANVVTGRGSTSSSGSKAMQDGWGGGDRPTVASTRPPSWEEEEDGSIGLWNSAGTQESSSPYNSTNWTSSGKKIHKGSMKGGNNDTWINPLSTQFSKMGLLREPSEDGVGNKMDLAVVGLSDKKLESDKRGMNMDYNGMMRKDRSGFRPPNSKDSPTADSGPYFEKNGNHGLFGGSTAQSRGVHTPQVQPMNSSQPNLRAQVPPQFLPPPQVPASMLKHTAPNGALNPALFSLGPQLSPQQIAMLSQLPQLPQLQLAYQLLIQQQQQQVLQNQRKLSAAVRQQQEQQLARIVSALQQQQQQQHRHNTPGMKHSPSHPGIPKQHLDNVVPNSLPSGLPDFQTKGQLQPGYPMGLGSNMNVNQLDVNSIVGMKEPQSQQSRLKQWTTMEGLSPATPPPDHNPLKNGAISSSMAPPKSRDSLPYYEMIAGDSLASHSGPASDNWSTPKLSNGSSSSSWPPEFRPGEPWKGFQNIDPESDPYATPASMINSSAAPPSPDSEHQLLRDRSTGSSSSLNTSLPSPGAWSYSASNSSYSTVQSTSAKFNDFKSTWSPDPIGHPRMWKNQMSSKNTNPPTRPPPGLTNQKPPSSLWGSGAPRFSRGWGVQDSRYALSSNWGDGSSGGSVRVSSWLLLHNLTPQIDGSTLRTICMQHGPLITFHLNLTHGTALVRYSTKQEAIKAQTALHMCVLGNTTILAEFVSEEEVNRYFAQGQLSTPSPGWQTLETGQSQMDPVGSSLHSFGGRSGLGQWNSAGGVGRGSGNLAGASLWATPSYTASLWGAPNSDDSHRMGSPAPLLPGDLLGGGADSI